MWIYRSDLALCRNDHDLMETLLRDSDVCSRRGVRLRTEAACDLCRVLKASMIYTVLVLGEVEDSDKMSITEKM